MNLTTSQQHVIVDEMDWDTALQTCVDLDSIIVSIHSRQHNEFLINMTLQVQPSDAIEMYAFWIGYYDVYNFSRWISGEYWKNFHWIDGSMNDYLNWGITYSGVIEPDYYLMALTPYLANRSCVVLLADYQGTIAYWQWMKTKWFDDNYGCQTMYSGTICQKDSNIQLNTTEANDIEFVCDEGWTKYGVKNARNQTKDMCYLVS
uniref:C-type lectin domain-containing protein n=1 Tax=Acrobeloides nanus TaxID=290746 RepID=A0A914CIF7_9BILA